MQSRKKRTEILIKSSTTIIDDLAADICNDYKITVQQEPQLVLVMNKVRESGQGSTFYLGEVLATLAIVEIDNVIGKGLIVGESFDKAKKLAIIDAGFQLAPENKRILWEKQLATAETLIQKTLQQEQARLNQTKVSFDTMDS